MTAPLFSIVIPTYNRSDLVHGAVRSVLRQTFGDFEVVVSDNGSEDDTRDVICSFQDARVRYVRTPTHTSIADSWEFARSQARGTLLMMLSDDDALVHDALEQFAHQHRHYGADFLFCSLAEYRDRTFIGAQRNTVTCPPFSGAARVVSKDEFLAPLFRFRPSFNMHPSAFIVGTRVVQQVVQRCGRFFRSNGVEYFAWPPAAVFARTIVYIEKPLVVLGRTSKSWGAAIVLSNPGKEQIAKMIADVEHRRDWIPLTNFTLCNLVAEGLLLSKQVFPDELAAYPFDEQQYLKETMLELRSREAMGVDVRGDIDELLRYARKYSALSATFASDQDRPAPRSLIRRAGRAFGLSFLRLRIEALRQARNIRRGLAHQGFRAAGADFGFGDAVECADFVASVSAMSAKRRDAAPTWKSASDTIGQRVASS